jgi:hypothetical protein
MFGSEEGKVMGSGLFEYAEGQRNRTFGLYFELLNFVIMTKF